MSTTPTPNPVGNALKGVSSNMTDAGDSGFIDPTDDDPADEGLAYLLAIHKGGKVPTKEDYAYAEKVRSGKFKKTTVANIVKNAAFWLFIAFNFTS